MITPEEYKRLFEYDSRRKAEIRKAREENRAKNVERAGRMLQMYMGEEMTLEQISVKFDLTRERVRQILTKTGLYVRRIKVKIPYPCKNTGCQNQVFRPISFCSRTCQVTSNDRKISERLRLNPVHICNKCGKTKPQEQFLISKRRGLLIPHSPCRECHSKTVLKWAKEHPQQKHDIDSKNVKAWHERLRKDPIRYQAYLERMRKYQKDRDEKIKADPIKHEEYLARARIRFHKKNERILAEVEAALKELKLI